MLGETVAVLTRRKTGEDEMGEPVWEWDSERVENVLVRPLSGSDLADSLRPDGIRPDGIYLDGTAGGGGHSGAAGASSALPLEEAVRAVKDAMLRKGLCQ